MKPSSAAADKEIWVKVIIKDTWFKPDSSYLILHEPISNSYGWVTKEQISKLEAQQTDTLSGLRTQIERLLQVQERYSANERPFSAFRRDASCKCSAFREVLSLIDSAEAPPQTTPQGESETK